MDSHSCFTPLSIEWWLDELVKFSNVFCWFEDSLPQQTIVLYHNHHLLSQHQLKKEHNCSIATHDVQLSVSIWASVMGMGIVMVLHVL